MLRRKTGTSDENVFELVTPFAPARDQPAAIHSLVDGIKDGATSQVLMGATGSGKISRRKRRNCRKYFLLENTDWLFRRPGGAIAAFAYVDFGG